MPNLKAKRNIRAKRTRIMIAKSENIRLSIHRSNSHIYAQLIDDKNNKTLASASSLELKIKGEKISGGNVAAASVIGKKIAEKALSIGILKIAFDRSGYEYHGRVKALADAARENGLIF